MKVRLSVCANRSNLETREKKGFSLIVTITMMILLSLIAVGILGLSSTTVRSANVGQDEQIARANARLALQLAVGQLQKYVGDDRRVTMAADQLTNSQDGDQTSAKEGYRYWTGVYEAWPDEVEERPNPDHLAWLVTSLDEKNSSENLPVNGASGSRTVKLVSEGTVGDDETAHVVAPLLTLGENDGGIAWWTGDQGLKAAVALPASEPAQGLAEVRREHQSASSLPLEFVKFGSEEPFSDFDPEDPKVEALTDWEQLAFFSNSDTAHEGLFHDLTARSTGLLVNVREGGFRKDLSMALETDARRMPTDALYSIGREDGINLEELGTYYNLYKELNQNRARYTTGGSMPSSALALSMERSPAACKNDEFHHYKQPTIISYQAVFSLEAKRVVEGRRVFNRLHLVIDPILTFWNPHDVPLMVPSRGNYLTVKYFGLPYDLNITAGGRQYRCPIIASLTSGDSNYLSLTVGIDDPLVFKPGEVIKFSQSGDRNVKLEGLGSNRHRLAGLAGFNFGGGVTLPLKTSTGAFVDVPADSSITYTARPNNLTAGAKNGAGNVLAGYSSHSRHFSMTHHSVYVGDDRGSNSLGIGGIFIDYDFGNKRLQRREVRDTGTPGTKPARERLYANRFPDVFDTLEEEDTRVLSTSQLMVEKAPIMMYSYNAKTESAGDRGTRSFLRFNPKAHHVDFYDLSEKERDMLPYEIKVEALNSWVNRNLETSSSGNAYFGGGFDASTGTSFVITHSVPREPLASIAALQHSTANGFLHQKPVYGYATLNAREPLAPQISHAIGNSYAPSVLSEGETSTTTSGGRALADHSYLANEALWDDWFFSTIAPEVESTFSERRAQRQVAEELFNGEGELLNPRYQANLGELEPQEVLASLFSGNTPTGDASELVAAFLKVEGLFNVNSTSVTAWQTLLSALNEKRLATLDELGSVSETQSSDGVPVVGLFVPSDQVAEGEGQESLTDPAQWTGRRALTEGQIEVLAEAIVREVRKRGPFLSLADFVNRRPNGGEDLARAGTIQAAIDSDEVGLNAAFEGAGRSVDTSVASRFAFPEAEEGAISAGIPGVIKQADVLTPIAPLLSVRSDTFIIRAYGESRGPNGKVRARAWCEAQVQREADYLSDEDDREIRPDQLTNPLNKEFGRRFRIGSFRWLSPSEV